VVTTPRFLVSSEALLGPSTIITGRELHHLRVLRLRVGSELVIFDGRGQQRRGVVIALNRHQAVIRPATEALSPRESPINLILAQALLKADKLDLVIEKTTELGVSEIVLFTGERTVGRPSTERQERWKRIARSAAKQSQRGTVPAIAGPISFDAVLSRHADARRLLFWEEHSGGWMAATKGESPRALLTAIGPEGGFSAAEAERASNAGFFLLRLAPRILRAETAAIVAVALCQFLWGDLAAGERYARA
jgi:16S rRNA (uracil1498-N3)-methyltransferase